MGVAESSGAHDTDTENKMETQAFDMIDFILNPEKYEAQLAAAGAEYEAEKAARIAAEKAAEAKKVAEYKAAGFFWNNLRRHYACGRCSGTGVLRQYKHVSGGVCFNCDGEAYRL